MTEKTETAVFFVAKKIILTEERRKKEMLDACDGQGKTITIKKLMKGKNA